MNDHNDGGPTEPPWDPNDPWGTGNDAPTTPDNPATTPDQIATERATLAAILHTADDPYNNTEAIFDKLNSSYFTRPEHEDIYDTLHTYWLNHHTINVLAIAHHYRDLGDNKTAALIINLDAITAPPAIGVLYASDLRTAHSRRLLERLGRGAQTASTHTAPEDLIAATEDTITNLRRALHHIDTANATHEAQTITDFLAGEDEPYDWLVPGLLERQDRLIVTAAEGAGKSTLLRQLGIQLAAGIHPFTLDTVEPIRVLYIDLENSRKQTRRNFRALDIKANATEQGLDGAMLHVVCRVEGLDLATAKDLAWIANEIDHSKPDILITGPIYKMGNGDPNSEEVAKPIAMALDKLRADHGIAVILEAHSNKSGIGTANRSKEPYGWSGWLRWPEFGIHLGELGEVSHWRGMRDEREFPETLRKGGFWPWMPTETLHDKQWRLIRDAIKTANADLSQRDIAKATKLPRTTVQNILHEYAQQYRDLRALMPPKSPTGPLDGTPDDTDDGDDTDPTYPY